MIEKVGELVRLKIAVTAVISGLANNRLRRSFVCLFKQISFDRRLDRPQKQFIIIIWLPSWQFSEIENI